MTIAGLRLAPCGVVRAAAWPVDVLRPFGAPALHQLRPGSRGGPPAAFDGEYLDALERDQRHLWRHTFDDPTFLKGLLLSSPSAFLRAQKAADRRGGPRNRAQRLVEHTLYRYLARAAGRPTPHGMWAGVSDIRLGTQTRIETVAPRCHFTPDLRPFQSLVRGLARRDEYRARVCWQLNPTLQAGSEGGWQFLHRTESGQVELRQLGADALLGRMLSQLDSCAPLSLGHLADQLATCDAAPDTRICQTVLEQLAAGGVLVGGLDLPSHFASTWEALEVTADRLLADHARAWRATTSALRDQADALAEAVWSPVVEDLATGLTKFSATIDSLSCALGLPPWGGEQPVRCDFHLPWRLVLDRTQYSAIARGLGDYETHWQRGVSPAAAQRAHRRQCFARRLGSGLSLLDASALAAEFGGSAESVWPPPGSVDLPEVAARLTRWEEILCRASDEGVLDGGAHLASEDAPRYGCWLVGIGAGDSLRAHGVSDLPTLASARYGDVLDLSRHDRWLAAAFRFGSRVDGIDLTELHAPWESNPNALMRPALIQSAIAPWEADATTCDLRGARLAADSSGGRVVLRRAAGGRASVITALTSANLQGFDPLAEALLWSGHRESPGRAQRAVDVPTSAEFTQPRWSARIRLPAGAILCARRSVLSSELKALRQLRGSARFWYWQQLARRLEWPALLEVASERGGMLHVPRDSPLAVEALCKGIGDDTRYLLVQEAAVDAGLPLPGSGPHMVEAAIPFVRGLPRVGAR